MINPTKVKLLPLLLVLVLFLSSCGINLFQDTILVNNSNSLIETLATQVETSTSDISAPQIYEPIQVIFFDVGQADCTLIKIGNHAMLIDAGNIGQESLILDYLSDYNITALDWLVATHPHADHIGSMAAVIRAMESIGMIIMPDVIHTTSTFARLLDAIEEKDIAVAASNPGDTYEMENVKIQVLAPNSNSYTDLNNYSVVLRMEYGNTVFLLTGDAEDISENEQLAAGYDLRADVLKVGHHGSHSSTTQKYLNAVSPSYAVICCGADNSYGHPHDEIVSRLTEYGSIIYRTDQNGTIIFESDGNEITVITENKISSEFSYTTAPDNSITFIGNINSKIFHLLTCNTLPDEKNRVYFSSRGEAINNQYKPCQRCKP